LRTSIIFSYTAPFSYNLSPHLLPLHSFPTRRSSDLIVAVYTQPDRPAGRGRKLVASPVKQRALELGIPVEQPESLKTPEAQQRLDRKSTRLNSSHMKISYAVFCLKKKNKKK